MTAKRFWILWIFCLLFFLQRPWFFDDPSVIVSARAAAAHPLDPYTFPFDTGLPGVNNWTPGQAPSYTHPAFSSWILGAALKLVGPHRSEIPLHLLMFGIASAALWICSRLAGRFVSDSPLFVALLAFSPVYFLTTLTLYPHLFYFLFYALALWAALQIVDNHPGPWPLILGVAMALAALSLHQWPVLLGIVVALLFSKPPAQRRPSDLLGVGLFLLIYGGWCWIETQRYGMPQILATFHARAEGGTYAWKAVFLPWVFLAGGLPVTVIAWPLIFRQSRLIGGLLAAVAGLSYLLFAGPRGGFDPSQALLLSIMMATGLAFLALLPYLFRSGGRQDKFLILWFLAEFLFVQIFLVFPSGHHLLALALPTTLIAARALEQAKWPKAWILGFAGLLLALTLSLAQADLELAGIGPRVAADTAAIQTPRYYWGNDFSGFAYYLKRAGWQAYDLRKPLQSGDVLLIPQNQNMQGPPMFLKAKPLAFVGQLDYRIASPWRTLSIGDSAGWYSASWGALPYSLSTKPAEQFLIFRCTQTETTKG